MSIRLDELSVVRKLTKNLEKYRIIVPSNLIEEARNLVDRLREAFTEYNRIMGKIEELRAELKKERAVILRDRRDPSRFIGKVMNGDRKGMIVLFSPDMQKYLQENGAEPKVTQVILEDYDIRLSRNGKPYIKCFKCRIARNRSDVEKEIQNLEIELNHGINLPLSEILLKIKDLYRSFEASYEAYTRYGIDLIRLADFLQYNLDDVIDGREKSIEEIYRNPDVEKILMLPTDERTHALTLLDTVLARLYGIWDTPVNHEHHVSMGGASYSATHLVIPLHLECEKPVNNICPCGELCRYIEEHIGKIEEIPSYHIPTLGVTSNPVAIVKPYMKLTPDQIISINIELSKIHQTPTIKQLQEVIPIQQEKLEH